MFYEHLVINIIRQNRMYLINEVDNELEDGMDYGVDLDRMEHAMEYKKIVLCLEILSFFLIVS